MSYDGGVPSDGELLAAWKAGDEEAGQALVQRHMRPLYGFFNSKMTRDVEELIQRTWLACLESVESFRGEGSFRGWLFGIARHELYDHFRRVQREPIDFGSQSAAALDPSPSRVSAKRQELALMLAAMRSIPLDYQIALELYYWEGLTSTELADALGIPAGTVRSRIRDARAALTAAMAKLARSPELVESTVSDLADWALRLRDYLREAEGMKLPP